MITNPSHATLIQVESYSPLGQGESLSHPVIVQAARRHERTPPR